ncbi:unnamed protein product [Closterium sp. NIES-65]|nr:unnamed protein product [Closterium sp. NIES-65]
MRSLSLTLSLALVPAPPADADSAVRSKWATAMLLHVLLCVATSLPLSVAHLVSARPLRPWVWFLPPAALCRLCRCGRLTGFESSARRLPPAADAALARARGARERVEIEGGWRRRWRWRGGGSGGGGGGGGGSGGTGGGAVEAEVAAEVVAEEAVGAVGATVLVGEVEVETGVAVEAGGVAVEAGGRSGSSQRSSSGAVQRQQQQQQQPQQQPQQQQRSRTVPAPSAAP